MKINVVILEDNPITAQDLKEILIENDINVLQTFYAAEDALNNASNLQADIWLVDIKLKGQMTGIEFASQIGEFSKSPIIFLTANSDKNTVEEAISTGPASFLTKPFDDKDVIIAVELAFKKHILAHQQNINSGQQLPFVFLKSGKKFTKVPIEKISFLEADGSYCKVVTDDQEFTLSCNLNHFSSNISNGSFLRIHKSYAVNVDCITGIDNDYVFVDEKALPIGRVYKNEVKNMLKKFS